MINGLIDSPIRWKLTSWAVRLVGANSVGAVGLPSALAAKAEEFWRAFIQACGGEVWRYDAAIQ